jgi:hypothetical protein
LLVTYGFRLGVFFAHGSHQVEVGGLASLQLHNGAELGQAGVVLGLDVGIQETAGNIFELLVTNGFGLDVFFAHGGYQVWLVVDGGLQLNDRA